MRRGQSLVLICGTLRLPLTMMVCLTLSISRMTKKKMELQLAADTAASAPWRFEWGKRIGP